MGSYSPYIIIVICLLFSAFFSGSEIAYASLNRIRMKKIAETKGNRGKVAQYIYNHFDETLATILIGNNLVNVLSSSMGTIIAIAIAESSDKGAGIATAVMTVIILIFGEIAPKIIAKRLNSSIVVLVAYPIRLFMYPFKPFCFVVNCMIQFLSPLWKRNMPNLPNVTEDELMSLIETSEDEGVIDEERSDLLISALEFSEIEAQEILIPRVDMIALDVNADRQEVMELALEAPYTRIPVYEKSVDNIIGVLVLNRFLRSVAKDPDYSVRDGLMNACFIHKSMKLPAVLSQLKHHQMHLAIVTDEYGGTMGMITMEDILERLVGNIYDETDLVEEDFVAITDTVFECSGDMSLLDFGEHFDISEKDLESEYNTVGGWVIEQMGGYPKMDDSFQFQNLLVTVLQMDDLRVEYVRIEIIPEETESN